MAPVNILKTGKLPNLPVPVSSSVSDLYVWGPLTAIFKFTPLDSSCFRWSNSTLPWNRTYNQTGQTARVRTDVLSKKADDFLSLNSVSGRIAWWKILVVAFKPTHTPKLFYLQCTRISQANIWVSEREVESSDVDWAVSSVQQVGPGVCDALQMWGARAEEHSFRDTLSKSQPDG